MRWTFWLPVSDSTRRSISRDARFVKCREQYPLRRNALFDQISDAIGDRPRFSRARTGNNKRRFRLGSDNAKLLFVQLALVSGSRSGREP